MYDRIVVCKTFLLSKLWFLCQFIIFDKKFVREINGLVYRFVWNNAIELVKRDTLILPWERGGLGMFHLKAKLDCIILQQFIYISSSFERKFYCLSVYWLKFIMKDLNLTNFNIIPSGLDINRPNWYSKMFEIVSLMKKSNKKFMSQRFALNSKKTYEIFRSKYEKRPKCESNRLILNWEEVYEKTLNKNYDSFIRTLNFKILNNGLEFNMKFENRKKIKCFLCRDYKEDIDHLFINCQKTRDLFKLVEHNFENKINLNIMNIIYHLNLTASDSKMISIFKLSIWMWRNQLRVSHLDGFESLFLNLFYKLKREM
jgi:hypothetical protein